MRLRGGVVWLTLCMHLNQSCRPVPPLRAGCWRQRRAKPRSPARASRERLCAARLGGATPAILSGACSRRRMLIGFLKAHREVRQSLDTRGGKMRTKVIAGPLARKLLRSTARDRQTCGAGCTTPRVGIRRCQHDARHARITESDDAASAGAPFPPGSAATILRLRISPPPSRSTARPPAASPAASAARGPTG